MTRILFIWGCLYFCVTSFAQTTFIYNSQGKKLYFEIVDDTKVLYLHKELERGQINLIEELAIGKMQEMTPLSFMLISEKSKEEIHALLRELSVDVHYISDMLLHENTRRQWLSNSIIVKFMPESNIHSLLDNMGVMHQDLKRLGSDPNTYSIALSNPMEMDGITAANVLFESGKVVYAQPSFWRIVEKHNPYATDQWALDNTGQYGGTAEVDIQAYDAWRISTGEGVKVAVLDEGVDLTHPDLINSKVTD